MPSIDPRTIRLKRPGDVVTAHDYNNLLRLAQRTIRGPNVVQTPTGWSVMEYKPLIPSGVPRVLAGLTHFRQWTIGSASPGLFIYRYGIVTIGSDGSATIADPEDLTRWVWDQAFYAEVQSSRKLWALTKPGDGGTLPSDTEAPTDDVTFGVTQDGTSYSDSDGCSVWAGTTPGGMDIGFEFFVADPNNITMELPTDGSTFYLRFWSYYGVNPTGYRDYSVTIDEEDAGSFAMHIDSLNWIESDALRGPVGGYDPTPAVAPPDDYWTPLDPFIVDLFPVTVEDRGDIAFGFRCPDIEYWGKITGVVGDPNDGRYYVDLCAASTASSDSTDKLSLAARTGDKALNVVATNINEGDSAFQTGLSAGTYVRVLCTRCAPAPHVPRYWIIAGGSGSGYTGTFDLVNEICFDEQGCVSEYKYVTLEFEDGLLQSIDPDPPSECS